LDASCERLIVRAATIDELLTEEFESLPGQKADTDLAGRRLAAWCRSSASGDWAQFGQRLHRDGWDFAGVLERFATVRPKPSAPCPVWAEDAAWITTALCARPGASARSIADPEPCAFEHLLTPLVEQAEARLWSTIDARAAAHFDDTARAKLRRSLLTQLSNQCTPALYELFDAARKAAGDDATSAEGATATLYPQFVDDMRTDGFRRLFEDKPVLLRLLATITRQWIDVTGELITRLDADLPAIRRDLLDSAVDCRVTSIVGDLSDPHNCGHSVRILEFENGARVVYKPKDLRVDVALHALIDRLNNAEPPTELRAVRTLARDDYGWSEFIDHAACADVQDFERYFRRAGAWLALFYCFAASDMHQENIIASGEHPVPIDVETILQAAVEQPEDETPENEATRAAMRIIANSAMTAALLPSYERSPGNRVVTIGGMMSDWNVKTGIRWTAINTDRMRPARSSELDKTTPNLPHVGDHYARFVDHLDVFVAGFEAYTRFLVRWNAQTAGGGLFDGFAGLPVRKIPRPTRFYYLLLERLKDHRTMDDGVLWSAQADFVARLSDWNIDADARWPLARAERSALVALNVPYFVAPTDGTDVSDGTGVSVHVTGKSGLERATDRVLNLDEQELDWQVTIIRQNMESFAAAVKRPPRVALDPAGSDSHIVPTNEFFLAEANRVAAELSQQAIRRGPGAAWIALDWVVGDTSAYQLVCLSPSLYNGNSGIALFLAAHAAVTGCTPSSELALAAVAHLRQELRSRNAAKLGRLMGIGGGVGLGSIVYALAVMSNLLGDEDLLADARAAAALITDDLIAADRRLDLMGGSAGAILGLLRLYRDTASDDVLARATRCGDHLLRQRRVGSDGRRTWVGEGINPQGLNGMSHGAAGYAYALASLSQATGRADFSDAASECVAYENLTFDPQRHNWPDLRAESKRHWRSQWCHGAPGIGLARIAMARLDRADTALLTADIRNAVVGVESGWRSQIVDTLCCGATGSVEFLSEAGDALSRPDLRELASRRLAQVISAAAQRGDYRWSAGTKRFNPGLFKGLAGVGYTALRRVANSLPDVLLWQ
jgi:type 2 lantibiotic biosynthesis protein LanM